MASSQIADHHSSQNDSDIENNRDIAAFSYILIFAPILLVTKKESPFIRHHALQAVYLGFFFVIFALLPGKLSYVNIIIVAGALMGFLEAQAGHYYKMPVISDLIVKKITLQVAWNKLRQFFKRLWNVIQRVFTEGPGVAVRGTAHAIEKARGIDALAVNKKVEDLEKEIRNLQQKIDTLESKNNEEIQR
jgi:uncharacterized membrane protein